MSDTIEITRATALGGIEPHRLPLTAYRRPSPLTARLPLTAHRSLLTLCFLLVALSTSTAHAQTVADKMVATVSNGSVATPDLITYSDLVWQLALEPDTPFSDHPSSEQLNEALRTLEDQLLILQEARKLPGADSAEAQKELDEAVRKERDDLAQRFPDRTKLEERMQRVGLTSDQLNSILRDRVAMERYLDFRFRAFVLITPQEITDRYNRLYGSVRNSGKIVPTLEEVRSKLEHDLIEERIAAEIDKFVDNLREQLGTEIIVLNPV